MDEWKIERNKGNDNQGNFFVFLKCFKGLEPEIERIIKRNKEDTKKMEEKHR